MKKRYNWLPDEHDPRDHVFALPHGIARPPSIDLTAKFPPPFDQGQEGSCTANALGGQMAFLHGDQIFSRQFIYRGERAIEHTIRTDAGARIRDGVKFLSKAGCCLEAEWPYTPENFKKKPPAKCFDDALPFKISEYMRLSTVDDMLNCLAMESPFVFGFTVYDSFESEEVATTGAVNLPQHGESILGGHAVEAVGYDLAAQRFKVRNSWGDQWGQGGYFTMPFDYLASRKLADDFWTIRK
jgi:C1A family cysteine protease